MIYQIWDLLLKPSPAIAARERRQAMLLSGLLLLLLVFIGLFLLLDDRGIQIVHFGAPANRIFVVLFFAFAYGVSRTNHLTLAVVLFLVGAMLEVIYLAYFSSPQVQTRYLYYLIWPIIASSFFLSRAAPGLITLISLVIAMMAVFVDRSTSFFEVLTGPLGMIASISGLGGILAYFRSQAEQDIQEERFQQQTAKLAGERKLLRMTSLVAQKLLETPTWMGRLPEVLEILGVETGAERVSIYQRNVEKTSPGSLRIAAWWDSGCPDGVDYQQVETLLQIDNEDNTGVQKTCIQDAIIIRRRDTPPTRSSVFAGNSVETILSIPISNGNDCWGWMLFENCTGGKSWSDVDVDALKLSASIFFSAIEREGAEQALRESEERFRSVAKSAKDAIITIDSRNRIVYWNDGAEKLFGYPSNEILGEKIEKLTPGQFKSFHSHGIQKAMASGKLQFPSTTVEGVGVRKDGSHCPVELSFASWSTAQGHFFSAIIRDITERKKAAEALQRAYNQIQQLLASISSILIGLTPDEVITHWNNFAVEMFDIPPSQALHRRLADLSIDWSLDLILDGIQRCRSTNKKVRVAETTYVRPDGHAVILGFSVHPILDEHHHVGFLLLGTDITQNKIIEQQLAQSHKMDSLGQLASGIAHEINTPAQFVTGNLRFLGDQWITLENRLRLTPVLPAHPLQPKKPDTGTPSIEYLMKEYPRAIEQSIEGMERIARIVGAMRIFSYPVTERKSSANINLLIENSLVISRNNWRQVAEVSTDYASDLPEVLCHPAELSQAFLNIIINAADAIGERQQQDPLVPGLIKIQTRWMDRSVEVRISDNGIGIPKKIHNRIFDYFFTTKDVNQGTGQGLAITYNTIVKRHSGSLWFESSEGVGTTFIIQVPVDEPALPGQGVLNE